jgi:hypothetical protein
MGVGVATRIAVLARLPPGCEPNPLADQEAP